jgi:hypothetical protein
VTKSTSTGAGKSAHSGKKRRGGLPDEEAADEDDDEGDIVVRPAESPTHAVILLESMACAHSRYLFGVSSLVIAAEQKDRPRDR